MDFEDLLKRYKAKGNKAKLKLMQHEILDRVDFLDGKELNAYLDVFYPKLIEDLRSIPFQFTSTLEQECRYLILEILYKTPKTASFLPLVHDLMSLCLNIIVDDNEKNASRCVAIIFSLFKVYRTELEHFVSPFMSFVHVLYQTFPSTVNSVFQRPHELSLLKKSTCSFKMMKECPLLIMLLFQVCKSYMNSHEKELKEIVAQMFASLKCDIPSRSEDNFREYCQVSAAQIKTLAFLTSLLRGDMKALLFSFQEDIIMCTILLLTRCPSELFESRKEVLIATRNLINSDFRQGLKNHLAFFFSEETFNSSFASRADLRPLAYTAASELFFNLRESIGIEHTSQVILLFCKSIHDPSLPLITQVSSVRMILNAIDSLYESKDAPQTVVKQLALILGCFVSRLCQLRDTDAPETEEELALIHSLVQFMLFGLKTVVWCIVDVSRKLEPFLPLIHREEFRLIEMLLDAGFKIFEKFYVKDPPLEQFASVFTQLDAQSFRSLFSSKLHFVIEQLIHRGPSLMVFPQYLLANSNMSIIFVDIGFGYVSSNLKRFVEDTDQAKTILNQFFKIIIRSMNLYPSNEKAVEPFFKYFLDNILSLSLTAEHPESLLMLLSSLFKGLGSGKFESIYTEFFPFIAVSLMNFQTHFRNSKGIVKALSLELCLTSPARLSSLLPFMDILCEAVSLALSSGKSVLIKLALRTLEFWLDNLSIEFLRPFLDPFFPIIVKSLGTALKSRNASRVDRTCLRVLGEIGGLSQVLFQDNSEFQVEPYLVDGMRMEVLLNDNSLLRLPCDVLVQSVENQLMEEASDESVYESCFQVLQVCLSLVLDISAIETEVIERDDSSFEVIVVRRRPLRMAEDSFTQRLFTAIVLCSSKSSKAADLMNVVVQRFTALYNTPIERSAKEEVEFLDENVLVKALVVSLSVSTVSENAIGFLNDLLLGLDANCPIFDVICDELCHLCFHKDVSLQFGALKGFPVLLDHIPNGKVKAKHAQILRALLLCYSDKNGWKASSMNSTTTELLQRLFDVCTPDETHSEAIQRSIGILALSLVSPCDVLRSHTQQFILKLASIAKQSASSLLDPFKEKLFLPLIKKRSSNGISESISIGYIESLSFALSLDPPLVSIDSNLQDLCRQVLQELQDRKLDIPSKKHEKHCRRFVQLLRLLKTVLSVTQRRTSKEWESLRGNSVKAFFRSLVSAYSPSIVEEARSALSTQENIPKEILRDCLRPILLSLGDFRKLDIKVLDTLDILLDLLKRYFNAQLGENLLQHLDMFAQSIPKVLEKDPTGSGIPFKVILKIYELFPRIPAMSPQVIVKVIHNLVTLEKITANISVFGGCSFDGERSPFRTHLMNLIESSDESVLRRFLDPSSLCRKEFSSILMDFMSSSKSLRIKIAEDPAFANLFGIMRDDKTSGSALSPHQLLEVEIQVCRMLLVVLQDNHKYLETRSKILKQLFTMLKRMSTANPDTRSLVVQGHIRTVSECLLLHLSHSSMESVGVLFYLCLCLQPQAFCDLSFIPRKIKKWIDDTSEEGHCKDLWNRVQDDQVPVQLMDHVLCPLAAKFPAVPTFEKISKFFQSGVEMQKRILTVIESVLDAQPSSVDQYQLMEFLNVCRQSQTLRPNALLCLAKYIQQFGVEEDKASDIFEDLLMVHDSSSESVYKAVDLLFREFSHSDVPFWIEITKRRVKEDSYSVSQMYHLWSIVKRHEALYFEHRKAFIAPIASSLDNFAIVSNRPSKYKQLALDLVLLLLEWNERDAFNDGIFSRVQFFLLQFLLRSRGDKKTFYTASACDLLEKSFKSRPHLHLNNTFMEKIMSSSLVSTNDLSLLALALKVLLCTPDDQFFSFSGQFEEILKPSLASSILEIQDRLVAVVKRFAELSMKTELQFVEKEILNCSNRVVLELFSSLHESIKFDQDHVLNVMELLNENPLTLACIQNILPMLQSDEKLFFVLSKLISGPLKDQILEQCLSWCLNPSKLLCILGDLDFSDKTLSCALSLMKQYQECTQEFSVSLQFLLRGLAANNPRIKKRSLSLLHEIAMENQELLLLMIFSEDSWTSLCDFNWIPHAVIAYVSTLDPLNDIRLPMEHAKFRSLSMPSFESDISFGHLFSSLEPLLLRDESLSNLLFSHLFQLVHRELFDHPHFKSMLFSNFSLQCNSSALNTIMTSLSQTNFLPNAIESDQILCIAQKYGIWVPCMTLLRDSPKLSSLYRLIHEEDVFSGMHHTASVSTRAALTLQQLRLWHRARDAFTPLLGKLSIDQTDPIKGPRREELEICESEWIRCLKHLNQWETLHCYAQEVNDVPLIVSSAFHLGHWDMILNLRETPKENAPTVEFPVEMCLYSMYGSLINEDTSSFYMDFEHLCDIALEKWNLMPNFVSQAHTPLLSLFQQILELKEAQVVLSKVRSLKGSVESLSLERRIEVWRQRLPNAWDDLMLWTNILNGREHTFAAIINELNISPISAKYFKYHDIPWLKIQLSRIARKFSIPSVGLEALETLSESQTLSSSDAFGKLSELIKIVKIQSTENRTTEKHLPLAIMLNTNLDYFSDPQKAQLFKLKAEALDKLGYFNDCHYSFMAATLACGDDGKSWTAWGNFCDRVFSSKKEATWAEYAISCYLQGVAHGNDKARLMISRVLWLLGYGFKDGPILNTFKKYAPSVPLWTWILWIPQLLSSLQRLEGEEIVTILLELAKFYPQALYFEARAHLLSKHDMRKKEVAQSDPLSPQRAQNDWKKTYIMTSHGLSSQDTSNEATNENVEFRLITMVFQFIQSTHPSLSSEIEKILDEISSKLKPSPEEELLGAINSLFIRCFKQPISSPDTAPKSLITCIQSVYSKFFLVVAGNDSYFTYLEKHKANFEADFLPSSPNFPKHLTELMRRLKKWKSKLLCSVGHFKAQKIRMESLSAILSHSQPHEFEIPGQYMSDCEPSIGQNVLLEGFHPLVYIRKINFFSPRVVGMIGSDGHLYHYMVQYSIAHMMRTEERNIQLQTVLNRLYRKSNETIRRNCHFEIRTMTPLTHRLSLSSTKLSDVTLEDVFEETCSVLEKDADIPLTIYRNHMGRVSSWERNRQARKEVFKHISDSIVPEDMLLRYIRGRIKSEEELWVFRKEFAVQSALSAFISYIMHVGERFPHRLTIDLEKGKLIHSEFFLYYNVHQIVESKESVPFRLTPNMVKLMGPHILHGLFRSALLSQSTCLIKYLDVMKNFMYVFFRDDIASYCRAMSHNENLIADLEGNGRLRERVSLNTGGVLERIRWFIPEEREIVGLKVDKMIAEASDASNLSMMNPVWYPWL